MAGSNQRSSLDIHGSSGLRANQGAHGLIGPNLRDFTQVLNDPNKSVHDTFRAAAGKRGLFYLCLGSTHTSDVPGISAAGATPEMRRLTPCMDAEALVMGKIITAGSIPVSPAGVASPVVITRACLSLLPIDIEVVDCGTFVPPQTNCTRYGAGPAACLSSGKALPLDEVEKLFEQGLAAGKQASRNYGYVVVGECVPGGTTTAMGVLTALGFDVNRMLSSSLPSSDHELRLALVRSGIRHGGWDHVDVLENPLRAVSMVGDPMQAFAAGLALGASRQVPVVLAGGSQMLAVYALFAALSRRTRSDLAFTTMVATTKWVAFDQSADTQSLSRLIGAPFLAACPDFGQSQHEGLRAYENGHVKEGAGAGGSMVVADLVGGFSHDTLLPAIEDCYEELVVQNQTALF